jgi:hypothetical protein
MADINYSSDAGGYTLQTAAGPGFQGPGGMKDLSGFFEALAAKKAAEKKAMMDEDRRRWEADFRLREQAQQFGQRPPEMPKQPIVDEKKVAVVRKSPIPQIGSLSNEVMVDPNSIHAQRGYMF